MAPNSSTGNVNSTKQYRTTINLPNNRGHLSLTSQEKPEILLNAFVKSLDTQLFSEEVNDTTWYIHDHSPDGPVIGTTQEQTIPTNMSNRFYNDARKQSSAQAA